MATQDFVFEYQFDLDLLAERRPQQFGGIDEQHVDVGFARLQRLLAGEGEQVLGEIGTACCCFVDHPSDRRKLRLFGDRIGQNLDGSGDDGEDIVEVMGDAAGELAEGFHLLGLPDPVLCRDLVGEIAQEAVQDKTLAGFHRGGAQLGPEFFSIAAPGYDFAAALQNLVASGAQKARQTCSESLAIGFPDQEFDEVLAKCFLARPSENHFGLRIPVEDAATLVDLDKCIERSIDDAAGLSFAFAQYFLGQIALGHIAADIEKPFDRLGPNPHPRQRHDTPVLMDAA